MLQCVRYVFLDKEPYNISNVLRRAQEVFVYRWQKAETDLDPSLGGHKVVIFVHDIKSFRENIRQMLSSGTGRKMFLWEGRGVFWRRRAAAVLQDEGGHLVERDLHSGGSSCGVRVLTTLLAADLKEAMLRAHGTNAGTGEV